MPEIIREVEERLQLTPEEQEIVRKVLSFTKEQGIAWEDNFRLGFLSHMISLKRLLQLRFSWRKRLLKHFRRRERNTAQKFYWFQPIMKWR